MTLPKPPNVSPRESVEFGGIKPGPVSKKVSLRQSFKKYVNVP